MNSIHHVDTQCGRDVHRIVVVGFIFLPTNFHREWNEIVLILSYIF